MVIADNIAMSAKYCLHHYDTLSSASLFIGVIFFGFQVYADFSGYSDMARGIARMFGFHLTQNFKMPFFSRNPSEFWRKWHFSLVSFFTKYIYIPLGGKYSSKTHYIFLLLLIFFISGLWHGANWTFACWGLANGLVFIPYFLTGQLVKHKTVVAANRLVPNAGDVGKMLLTFNAINLTRVFFQSKDMAAALGYYQTLFTHNLLEAPASFLVKDLKWCVLLIIIEWFTRSKETVLAVNHKNRLFQYAVFAMVIAAIFYLKRPVNIREYYYFRF